MSSEAELIEALISRARSYADPGTLIGPGDDAAVIKGEAAHQVITTETLNEGVHFRHDWVSAADLAARALSSTLSDLAAMGATPRWVTLALTLTKLQDIAWVERFGAELGGLLSRLQVDLIGGDMSRGPTTSLTFTAGGSLSPRRALTQGSAKLHDGLWVSGNLGGAGASLAYLLSGGRSPEYTLAYRRPKARILLGLTLNKTGLTTSCCDLSDGLLMDASSLLSSSAPGLLLDLHRIPVATVARQMARMSGGEDSLRDWVLRGGEEFELLFTVNPRHEEAMADLSRSLELPLTRIGTVASKPGIVTTEGERLEPTGWDSFQ